MPFADPQKYREYRRRWRAQRARHSSATRNAVTSSVEPRQPEPIMTPLAAVAPGATQVRAQEPYRPILRNFDGTPWNGMSLNSPAAHRAPVDMAALGLPSSQVLAAEVVLGAVVIVLGGMVLWWLLSKGAIDSLNSCGEAITESVRIAEWVPKARL